MQTLFTNTNAAHSDEHVALVLEGAVQFHDEWARDVCQRCHLVGNVGQPFVPDHRRLVETLQREEVATSLVLRQDDLRVQPCANDLTHQRVSNTATNTTSIVYRPQRCGSQHTLPISKLDTANCLCKCPSAKLPARAVILPMLVRWAL